MNFNTLVHRLVRLRRIPLTRNQGLKDYATKSDNEVEIPVNPLDKIFSASQQKENGVIYDKKPFKILCEEGKVYSWCLCGHSKNQPFCDGTHKNPFLKITLRPIKFSVAKTKEYWLCNCKQTQNRPFCDGTHKDKEIQEKRLP